MVEWLKQYWFLLTALFAMGGAWGQAQYKIQTLEDAVKSNAEVRKEVDTLKSQSARIDERSLAIQQSQERQERMIEMLLNNQRAMTTITRSVKPLKEEKK